MEAFPPVPAWPIVCGPSSHEHAEEDQGVAQLEALIGAGGECGRGGLRLVRAKYHHSCVGRVVAVARRGRAVRR